MCVYEQFHLSLVDGALHGFDQKLQYLRVVILGSGEQSSGTTGLHVQRSARSLHSSSLSLARALSLFLPVSLSVDRIVPPPKNGCSRGCVTVLARAGHTGKCLWAAQPKQL
eukprot:1596072-Rhodomonas_salina.2